MSLGVCVCAGSLCQRASNSSGPDALQQQGRPLDPQELVDDEEDAGGLMRSASMMAWLCTFHDNSFDPDAVPDIAMADYLGGTVSVAANRPGCNPSVFFISSSPLPSSSFPCLPLLLLPFLFSLSPLSSSYLLPRFSFCLFLFSFYFPSSSVSPPFTLEEKLFAWPPFHPHPSGLFLWRHLFSASWHC